MAEHLRKIADDTPSGTPVLLVEDDCRITRTKTRSLPWMLGDGTWVVLVEGRSGGYLTSRISVDGGEHG